MKTEQLSIFLGYSQAHATGRLLMELGEELKKACGGSPDAFVQLILEKDPTWGHVGLSFKKIIKNTPHYLVKIK